MSTVISQLRGFSGDLASSVGNTLSSAYSSVKSGLSHIGQNKPVLIGASVTVGVALAAIGANYLYQQQMLNETIENTASAIQAGTCGEDCVSQLSGNNTASLVSSVGLRLVDNLASSNCENKTEVMGFLTQNPEIQSFLNSSIYGAEGNQTIFARLEDCQSQG